MPMARPFVSSFRDALRGVFHTFRSQRNARIHLAVGLAVVAGGVLLGLAPLEWAVVVLAIVLVVAAETVNTALETLGDAACPDHHPLVGVAKDVAAGAVLVTAVGAVVVGLLVFVPHLLRLLVW